MLYVEQLNYSTPAMKTYLCLLLSQEEVSESDVDPHFKRLFKQIAGNVGRAAWELRVNEMHDLDYKFKL